MTNLTKTSGKATYTEQLNSLRQEAIAEIKKLLNKYGFLYSFDGGNLQKIDLIDIDCEETLAERSFYYQDFPIPITIHNENGSEWVVLRSNKHRRKTEVVVESVDDLCIFADYLKAKYALFNS